MAEQDFVFGEVRRLYDVQLVCNWLKVDAMATIGAFEAKTHFSRRLEGVAGGEQVTIPRHGMPVAGGVPIAAPDRERIRQTIRRLKEFSEGQTLGGLSVRALREEGRR